MAPHLVLMLAVVVGLMMFISWIRRTSPANRQRLLKRVAIVMGGALLLLLALRGNWLLAALGGMIPLAQRLLAVTQLYKAAQSYRGTGQGSAPPNVSEVETRFLRMRLHHDSGAMTGEVLTGEFAGQALDQLEMAQILRLLHEVQGVDPQSMRLIEAYLDRRYGNAWRGTEETEGEQRRTGGGATGRRMSREEAYEVLGLQPGASHEKVIDAHRRLMQKVHPDRGGSNFLAAKINEAKDILLSV